MKLFLLNLDMKLLYCPVIVSIFVNGLQFFPVVCN